MCGIAGAISKNAVPAGMKEALMRLSHRGPDDSGFYERPHLWLGNTRLAIQDLSSLGHQPMQSADGRYTLVYNGELYNHWELRKKLIAVGAVFHSSSDTETLLAAWVHFGLDCLQLLNGIFAFAIHDALLDELIVARDQLGVKPLYYYKDSEHFVFASELKSLAHLPGLDYSINPKALYNYILLLYSPDSETPFRNVKKLLPGHFIRIVRGTPGSPQHYYHLPFNGKYETETTEKDWINRTDEALKNAVSRQLISNAPIGFFLSGGLDSSLIAAIAKKAEHAQAIECFTIDTGGGFKGEGFEDDLHYARIAARHIGANLIEVPGAIDLEAELDNMVWHLDEPQADPAALHVLHIAQAARNMGIKVLLSGAGADDVFSGYRRHQALHYEALTRYLPDSAVKYAAGLAKVLGKDTLSRRLQKWSLSKGNDKERRIGTNFWSSPEVVSGLFLADVANEFPSGFAFAVFENLLQNIPQEHSPLNQMLYTELSTFLPHHNLNYTDKMSMAASIETRVPFLDIDLVALSATMPPGLKMKGTTTKYLLREVAKSYLPESLILRKKTGFGAPVRDMIKGPLRPFVRERLCTGSLQRWNIFNTEAISRLIDENQLGKTDAAYPIFALLCIESWLRQFCTH